MILGKEATHLTGMSQSQRTSLNGLSFRCSQTAKKSGVSLGGRNLTGVGDPTSRVSFLLGKTQSRVRYSVGRLGMVFATAFHPEISSLTSFPASVGRSYLPVICRLSPGNKEK